MQRRLRRARGAARPPARPGRPPRGPAAAGGPPATPRQVGRAAGCRGPAHWRACASPRQPLTLPPSLRRPAAADSDLTQEDLEAQLEEFMRRQAEIESGAASRKAEPGKVLGADEVSEEARRCCRGAGAGSAACGLDRMLAAAAARRVAKHELAAAALARHPPSNRAPPRPRRPRRRPSACAARWWAC